LKKKKPALVKKIDFVGFGNLPLIRHLDHKPAASVEENSYEMGEEAARLIFQHIHSEDSGNPVSIKKIQIPCRLVIHKK
jgi:LacI family transcriptional regulator